MAFVLTDRDSISNEFLRELRDVSVQCDRMRFRRNVERLGEIMAYEVSKTLDFVSRDTVTPLGSVSMRVPDRYPVLVSILRAGLPFFQGFVNFFDKADCGFIGAFRKEGENNITVKLEYLATPSLDNKTVVLIDPMLATGRSVIDSVNAMLRNGRPSHLHIVSLVAAPEGIAHIKQQLALPFSLWTCAVDEALNHQYYIVPGLGDAGDLSYGPKL